MRPSINPTDIQQVTQALSQDSISIVDWVRNLTITDLEDLLNYYMFIQTLALK